jgi:hypothetical protein
MSILANFLCLSQRCAKITKLHHRHSKKKTESGFLHSLLANVQKVKMYCSSGPVLVFDKWGGKNHIKLIKTVKLCSFHDI